MMLIVCPNCSTSYTVEQGSLGPAGRTVRCARCKSTWFAGGSKAAEPDLDAFVDRVIVEARAQPAQSPESPPLVQSDEPAPAASGDEASRDARDAPPDVPAEPQQAAGMADHAADGAGIQAGIVPMPVTDAPSLVPPNEPEPLPDLTLERTEAEQEDI